MFFQLKCFKPYIEVRNSCYIVFSRTGRAGNKGHAYTFLTTEQGRYAGDIIKALEQSGNPIPEDLQKLWDDYKMKQESVRLIFFAIFLNTINIPLSALLIQVVILIRLSMCSNYFIT